jgi:predicted DNA-binding protein
MTEMVRVNTRISHDLNAWLDSYSQNSGVPKSTLIHLALENYRREKEAFEMMGDMSNIMNKIDSLEGLIKQLGDKKHD